MAPVSVTHTLIIGIGNAYRGDDGAGLVIARQVRRKNLLGVTVIEHSGEGAALMECWKAADAKQVIIVDAVSSGAEAGKVFRFEANMAPLPTSIRLCSSHAFGLAEAVELARVMGELPPRLVIYGIEGRGFGAGKILSASVRRAVSGVIAQIMRDVLG